MWNGEHLYVNPDEIKKALNLKAAVSQMLDQMQCLRRILCSHLYVRTNMGVSVMTTTDPMTTVRQYIDGFNRGDSKAMAAAFSVPGSILDGMAPHVWHGPTAAQDWYRDVLVEGEHAGATGYVVTLGEPRHFPFPARSNRREQT